VGDERDSGDLSPAIFSMAWLSAITAGGRGEHKIISSSE